MVPRTPIDQLIDLFVAPRARFRDPAYRYDAIPRGTMNSAACCRSSVAKTIVFYRQRTGCRIRERLLRQTLLCVFDGKVDVAGPNKRD